MTPTPVVRHRRACLWLGLLGLLLIGCGESGAGSSYGDWTMTETALQLTEDLRVGETDAFYFGDIADLSVRADGRIAVADPEAHTIKVLRSDGTLAHTLGQAGAGPGEYQRLSSVQWARGDSLYAFDTQDSRVTVYAPAAPHPLRRSVGVSREDGFPVRVRVVGGQLVVEMSSRVPPSDGDPRYRRVRRLSEAGTPGDTLVTLRRLRSVVVSDEGLFRFRPVPFGREAEGAVGPDGRLYTGWQDSLRVVAHALDGTSAVVADVPVPAVPIPEADRDSVLARIDNAALRRAAAAAMPETRAAFTHLVVADDGRLWVRRPPAGPEADTAPWWALDPETMTIRAATLPREVTLRVVRDGHAYGTTTTETGAPALVRYRIGEERG